MKLRFALRAWTISALLLASISINRTAFAQTADVQQQARILYQKGNAAFKKGDSILARDYYKKSLALYESFDTVCNLGRVQAQDKLYVDAYESLVWCAHLYPVDDELADARIKFIRLRDEVATEISPIEQREVDQRIHQERERRRAAEAERALGAPPLSGTEPSQAAGPPPRQAKRSPTALPVSLAVGGVGVAGLGVGAGFLLDSIAKNEDAEDLRDDLRAEGVSCAPSSDRRCSTLKDLVKKEVRSAERATATFIVGGVMVVGAVITYLVWPKTHSVSVGGVRLHHVVPTVNYERATGVWQAGITGRF